MEIKKIKRLTVCLVSIWSWGICFKSVLADEILEQEEIVTLTSEILNVESTIEIVNDDSSEGTSTEELRLSDSEETSVSQESIEVNQSEFENTTRDIKYNERKDKIDHEKHQSGLKEFAKSLVHEPLINNEGSKELVFGGLEPFMQTLLNDKRVVFTPQTTTQRFRLPEKLSYDLARLQTDLPKNKFGDAGRFTIHPSMGNMSIVIVGDNNYPDNEKLVVAIDDEVLVGGHPLIMNLSVNGENIGSASEYFDLTVSPIQGDRTQCEFALTIKKEGLKLKGDQLSLSFELPTYTRFDATYSGNPFSITKDNSKDMVSLIVPFRIDAEEPIVELDNETLTHIVDLKTPGIDRTSAVASGVSNLTLKNAQTEGYKLVVKRSADVTPTTFIPDKLFYKDKLLTTNSLQEVYETVNRQSVVTFPLHELLQFRELSNDDLVTIYEGKNSVALDWIIQPNTDSLTSVESL
ncbi:hypothetical protein OL233_02680 [Vagococcus sp. PNs007]|uniref:WxL domain-containing protein n=1 Tax=Vagococcus proximus TaxID=2991417 RepID=A0ABT5WZJ6_9ENTE|nr:hypothetical protein [Vagococcus proximus]MDF0479182.1 hypothetical protein [Vagococcus proximus]